MSPATAAPLAPTASALTAAEVGTWFANELPVAVIDARLMQALESRAGIRTDDACEIFALIDRSYRKGTLQPAEFRQLKARINPAIIGNTGKGESGKAVRTERRTRPTERVRISERAPSRSLATPADTARHAEPARAAAPLAVEPLVAPPVQPQFNSAAHVVAGLQPLPRSPRGSGLHPGRVLRERYVIQEQLGEGGMSGVYRALDRRRDGLSGQDGMVALKVLRPALSNRPDAIQALRHEYERAQRLSHPGIVNVFDLDSDGDTHFFTMELLGDGELLSDVIRRLRPAALERSLAMHILGQIAEAIAFSHDSGIIHADVKPGNVMLLDGGEVRLFDFGTAWLAQREPWIVDPAMCSLQGATPGYASPERLGAAAPTTRDDVFSFCCLAYELLSGAHPFGRRPATEARDSSLEIARIKGISRRQWRVLKQGLSFTRAERPADMHEVARELGLVTRPLARAQGGAARVVRAQPVRRESLVAGLSMLLAAVLTIAAARALYAHTPAANGINAVSSLLHQLLR